MLLHTAIRQKQGSQSGIIKATKACRQKRLQGHSRLLAKAAGCWQGPRHSQQHNAARLRTIRRPGWQAQCHQRAGRVPRELPLPVTECTERRRSQSRGDSAGNQGELHGSRAERVLLWSLQWQHALPNLCETVLSSLATCLSIPMSLSML